MASRPLITVLFVLAALPVAWLLARKGPMIAGALLGATVAATYVYWVFRKPVIGLWSALIYSFLWSIFWRYVWVYAHQQIPFGLGIDGLLVLTIIAMVFKGHGKARYSNLRNVGLLLACVWLMLCALQVLNPNAVSMLAWVFTIRQYALYLVFAIVAVLMLANQRKDLDTFLNIFIAMSVFGALWGIKQQHFGLGYVDNIFVQPKANTHILFGKLRVFSIFDNAGQAGVSQGQAAVVATAVALYEKKRWRKIAMIVAALLCYYGMAISGTRGALAVPLLGLGMLLTFSRNVRIIVAGYATFGLLLFLLVFTTIGNSNYTVNRMRTAFDPEDASFQYRMEARAGYEAYLNAHFWGWGLGSAGYWGARFSGDENVMGGTDGGYVQIQAETGMGGLLIYAVVMGLIALIIMVAIWRMRDMQLRAATLGQWASLLGLLVANYGNSVIFQPPTNLVVSMSIAFMFLAIKWEKGEKLPAFPK